MNIVQKNINSFLIDLITFVFTFVFIIKIIIVEYVAVSVRVKIVSRTDR